MRLLFRFHAFVKVFAISLLHVHRCGCNFFFLLSHRCTCKGKLTFTLAYLPQMHAPPCMFAIVFSPQDIDGRPCVKCPSHRYRICIENGERFMELHEVSPGLLTWLLVTKQSVANPDKRVPFYHPFEKHAIFWCTNLRPERTNDFKASSLDGIDRWPSKLFFCCVM